MMIEYHGIRRNARAWLQAGYALTRGSTESIVQIYPPLYSRYSTAPLFKVREQQIDPATQQSRQVIERWYRNLDDLAQDLDLNASDWRILGRRLGM